METGPNRIIANSPVDRSAIQEFNGFEFNAWSPLRFQFEAEGDAEDDSAGKNHGGSPLSQGVNGCG
jgi:hypothetical protein